MGLVERERERDPSRRRVAFLSSSPIRRPISFSFLSPFLFLPLCFILERREFVARSSSNAKKGVPGGTRGAEKMFRENRWRGCNRSAVERGRLKETVEFLGWNSFENLSRDFPFFLFFFFFCMKVFEGYAIRRRIVERRNNIDIEKYTLFFPATRRILKISLNY